MNIHHDYGKIADGNASIEAVWKTCQNHPIIRLDFENQAKVYGWKPEYTEFSITNPFFVYWLARNVIKDEWIPGEDVIMTDDVVWKTYIAYTENMKATGSLGWSIKENKDFVIDINGQIRGWKPGQGPVVARRMTLANRFGSGDAAVIADRIAEQMREFKNKKKLREASQEDNNED